MSKLLENLKTALDFNDKRTIVSENKTPMTTISPLIKELMEDNFSTGKKKSLNALRKLIRIAESEEPIAKSFMRDLNSAIKIIGERVFKKLESGKFRGRKIEEIK